MAFALVQNTIEYISDFICSSQFPPFIEIFFLFKRNGLLYNDRSSVPPFVKRGERFISYEIGRIAKTTSVPRARQISSDFRFLVVRLFETFTRQTCNRSER